MSIFDYNPSSISPYPYWRWNKVLPAVYDDSLSQYEILSKLNTVNEIIESTNTTGEQVEQLTMLVQQLIDGGFPSGLVSYVEQIAQAAIEDDVAAINEVISQMQGTIDSMEESIQGQIDAIADDVEALQNAHRNEIWVVIGDSFSDPNLSGYISNSITVWPSIIRRNGVNVKNYSKSGAGYVHSTGDSFVIQAMNAANDTSYDHDKVTRVIIYGFVNDVSSSENTSTLMVNVQNMTTVLRNAFKYADIDVYPNWYVRQLSIQDQTYFGFLQLACENAHITYHQESAYLLMNYVPNNVFLSDNLHPNQLGQNIISSYFMNKNAGYSGRINGALTIIGQNTFDNVICNNSGLTLDSFSFGVNESCYDGFNFKCKTAMNTVSISAIPANYTQDIIIGLHFDSRQQRLWTNNLVIPVLVYGNVSNGYRGDYMGYINNDYLYVYVRPINE